MIPEENKSLKPFNSFGIDVSARYFATFHTLEELNELVEWKPAVNTAQTAPLFLGGGSNILFTGDYQGLVLKNEIAGIKTIREDEHHVYVQVGAGENWHRFVMHCIKNDWAGVENLSLIPGTVGASPLQNIGAYGVELKDVFYSLEAFHIRERKIVHFSLNDCAFGYRDSVFKGDYKNEFVITRVNFRLNRIPAYHINYGAITTELEKMGVRELSIRAIADAVIRIRSTKLPDPAEIGNAGSFFKNPVIPAEQFQTLLAAFPGIIGHAQDDGRYKLAAGWLIEYCGWKGFRRGDAGCHNRQALVLVNYGHASGQEIYKLSEEILHSVKKTFGVELEREVNIIGD